MGKGNKVLLLIAIVVLGILVNSQEARNDMWDSIISNVKLEGFSLKDWWKGYENELGIENEEIEGGLLNKLIDCKEQDSNTEAELWIVINAEYPAKFKISESSIIFNRRVNGNKGGILYLRTIGKEAKCSLWYIEVRGQEEEQPLGHKGNLGCKLTYNEKRKQWEIDNY